MKKLSVYLSLVAIFAFTLQSCSDSWLEAKPDKSLVVPTSIADYQALLDNNLQIFNFYGTGGLTEIAAGDFFITNASFASLFTVEERSAYLWAPTATFYGNENSSDWQTAYRRILNANVVLEGIKKIKATPENQADWDQVEGSALFFRSTDFFGLTQEYCKVYHPASADQDAGLPLRLEYDVNIKLQRASLAATYRQLIADLKTSSRLLGSKPIVKTRPSKQAAFATLARVYLSMEDYEQAGLYADSALQIQSELIDYSTLNAAATYPLVKLNTEVIFQNTFTYGIFSAARLITDPALYASYQTNDYRKTVFFKAVTGGFNFKGNYSGDKNLFSGLATDELYLIRAESKARKLELTAALNDLNTLLKKRWKGTYTALASNNAEQVLTWVLTERRKELAFRGIRWSDLRRLNQDSRFAVTLTRTIDGQVYTLPPNDKRYIMPLDAQEIALSGITQNDR
ncbi:RagB/SusD family nutrient uptake outer membrane protein [Pedobacter sp. PWIIR3]